MTAHSVHISNKKIVLWVSWQYGFNVYALRMWIYGNMTELRLRGIRFQSARHRIFHSIHFLVP